MKDIETRADIELLVNSFYIKVKADAVIGYIFTDVVNLSWEKHIPVMYSFWETILLGVATYKGNPMHAHIELDKKEQLKPAHFEQWVKLFTETIDENFSGPKAEEAKTRAHHMMALIAFKVEQGRKPFFIQ
jgi:hemoglobin